MRTNKKPFNSESFNQALELLQVVTPTDSEHQAHWWDTDAGRKIVITQEGIIADIKKYKDSIKTKMEFIDFFYLEPNGMLDMLEKRWPPQVPGMPNFWVTTFGEIVKTAFVEEVNKFIRYVNSTLT